MVVLPEQQHSCPSLAHRRCRIPSRTLCKDNKNASPQGSSAYPDEDEEKAERAVVHVPFSCPSSSHVSIMSDHVHRRVHVHVYVFLSTIMFMSHHVHHHVYHLSCPSTCLYLIMSIVMFMYYHVHHHIHLLSCPSSCLCSIVSFVVFMCYHVNIHVHVLS